MLTMFDAVRRHDPQRGELLPYVCTRLRWAMMSEARRGVRRVRLLSGGHRAEPRDPTFDEREHDAAYDEDYADSFEAPAPESNNPEEAVALKQATVRLTEALGKLPRRTRLVLVRHYFGGERFDHVARDLKISKTSVCRLHDMGKRMLREHISKTDRARAPRRPRS
jgi:RNA polymerase sigma factor for flagellar operon FliA